MTLLWRSPAAHLAPFHDKLQNLPEGLRPLAAHAHMPSVDAASCITAGALSSSDDQDLPSFVLCVAIPSDELHAPRFYEAADSVNASLAKEMDRVDARL